MNSIQFCNYSFAYQGHKKALCDIRLTIPHGSFTVISGPAGAGKTTLCMAINGLVPHYFGGTVCGQVLVNGQDTLTSKVSELAMVVGTVMEDYESQLVSMTVADEVAFGLESRGLEPMEILRRTSEVLALVGLNGWENREISSLSGGQKQRLAIATVLAVDAGILVLDEPASALDPMGAQDLYALLYKLNHSKGITIVVVEHDLALVQRYMHQMVFLDRGLVVSAGEPLETLRELCDNPAFETYMPELSKLAMLLAQNLCIPFTGWRTEQQAVHELAHLLAGRQEVTRSA